jgi:hypothetical protein
VLVGINYADSLAPLRGCINDVRLIQKFVCRQFGFSEQAMIVLTDEAQTREGLATRANMLTALQWLVSDARFENC